MSGPKSVVSSAVVRGPLAFAEAAYRAELCKLGYTPLGIVKQLRQVARLSRWLQQAGVEPAELSDDVLERFLAVRPGLGTASATGLAALLVVLRRAGLAVEAGQHVAAADDGVLGAFRRHLIAERGIGASTADRYVEYARRFLAERNGAAELSTLTSAEVTRCVQREAARVAVASAQFFVAGLRAFLRFCFVEGLVESDLSAGALAVTGRRRSSLPKGVSPAEAAALLSACDRRRGVGRRDYAILLVLLRLGLRAGETAGLTLDDIDWRAGQIVVHGKACRQDQLPLPADVGEAIVAYLRRGRPRCADREVFLRAVAPIGRLGRGGVSSVVRRACHRAAIPEVGAHRLRHTLACHLVTVGAGLPEIGHLLRHRSLTSTAIYARVEINSLRELALPWPGGESR
ncbi:MAG TPA: tyrosine-type recombinase/integrase [Mycobacterium sp.]